MADYNVIASVSETLQSVLTTAVSTLPGPPNVDISDLTGTISTTPARLTIFLFEVAEDPSARNKPRLRGTQTPPNVTISKPPMALVLRYLVTAWGGDRQTEHRLLGCAMQALYDGALIAQPDLRGVGLVNTTEVLKVTLLPLTLEERTRVWYSMQRPYRLSLYYEIRVVNLDSTTSDARRSVDGRSLNYSGAPLS